MTSATCMSPSRTAPRMAGGGLNQAAIVVNAGRLPPQLADTNRTLSVTDTLAPSDLNYLPAEVLVEVFQHLDMASASSLAVANRRLAGIFAAHRASIVLSIVQEEFSPFSRLLQVVKASPADLTVPWGTWLDKCVRRKHTVLCPGGTLPEQCQGQSAGTRITCAVAIVEDTDIDRILAVCRVVKGWERVFPQHRFIASPAMTRTLTRQENYRLRRALYNWMRFAYYFHGDLPRPSLSFPLGNDVRLNQLRALPNSELGELRDLWRTVEDIVELEICPSIANVRIGADFELSEKDVAQIGWGERAENRIVVSTVTKLSPEELLHYLDNRHKFTKQRLIQDIRQRHPQIESDMNSLTVALACVNRERWLHMLVTFPAYQPSTGGLYLPIYTRTMGQYRGGILNWDDPAIEAECAAVGEMTGLGLDWRPEPRSRAILQPGLLDP